MSGSSEQEVLQILFSRLFAVVAGMPANFDRTSMEVFLALQLDALKKGKGPAPHSAGVGAIQFFLKHPDLFDRDLREWVNLERLLRTFPPQTESGAIRPIQFHSSPSTPDQNGEAPSQKRRKLPTQNPASPLPGGRRKTRGSS
jgi:hypothetical protein